MTNKYESYENERFRYLYPIQWIKRNRQYLKLRENRIKHRDFIDPIVVRLRFYDKDDNILSDNFYTQSNNIICFPDPPIVLGMDFEGWSFMYGDEQVLVTVQDYTALKDAIEENYDDIKLTAKYYHM